MPRSFNEAYSQLAEILTKCIQNRFIVSRKKITKGKKIKYGGFQLEKKANQSITISADQARIQTIMDIEIPKTKTQVQSFLGIIKVLHNWYPTMALNTKYL